MITPESFQKFWDKEMENYANNPLGASERRISVEEVWSIFRQQFPRGESIRAMVPWGGDRGIIVTDGGVYLIEFDETIGFRVIMLNSR